jgi:hypothetical protein
LVCCIDQPLKFSWPRIQKGFDALEKQRGAAPENWNRLAGMAAIYNDPLGANKMLAGIGDQWSDEVWRTSSYFESVKHWAKHYRAGREKSVGRVADANLLADGQCYKNVFDEEIRALLPTCIQESGTDLSNFKILFRIGKG